jgi:hypothetical protein
MQSTHPTEAEIAWAVRIQRASHAGQSVKEADRRKAQRIMAAAQGGAR